MANSREAFEDVYDREVAFEISWREQGDPEIRTSIVAARCRSDALKTFGDVHPTAVAVRPRLSRHALGEAKPISIKMR